jgi:hypothetical protein
VGIEADVDKIRRRMLETAQEELTNNKRNTTKYVPGKKFYHY